MGGKEDRFIADASGLVEPGETIAHFIFCATKDGTGQNSGANALAATERALYYFGLKGSGWRGRVRVLDASIPWGEIVVGRAGDYLTFRGRDEQSHRTMRQFVPRPSRDEMEALLAYAESQGALREDSDPWSG